MTGLIIAFNWINKGIFAITNSKPENPSAPLSIYKANTEAVSIDAVYLQVKKEMPSSEYYNIRTPKDSISVFTAGTLPLNTMGNKSESYYIDQYTGKIVGKFSFVDKNPGQRILSFVKPIHTGEVFGLTTKIINFIIALLIITFPVTGIIMWLGRLKKRKLKAG